MRSRIPISIALVGALAVSAEAAARVDLRSAAQLTVTDLAEVNNVDDRTVAAAGDVNGDGLGDVIVGSPNAGERRAPRGEAIVVFGRRDRTTLDARKLGAAGLRIVGPPARDIRVEVEGGETQTVRAGEGVGSEVAPAGDVNGDGLGDVLVGAPLAGVSQAEGRVARGRVYLVFGRERPGVIDLAREPSAAVRLEPSDDAYFVGSSLAGIGDVNGDGRDDVAVGASARRGDAGGWIVYGGALPPTVQLGALGDRGVTLLGAGGPLNVAGAGDQDGDGLADVVVGSPSDGDRGRVRLVSRLQGAGSRDLATVPGLLGARGDRFGSSLAGGRDVTGDGRPDVVVGAPGETNAYGPRGKVQVIPGPWPTQLTEARAVAGPRLVEGAMTGRFGRSVDVLPDSTRDGRAEVLVGQPGTSPGCRLGAGSAWIFDGRPEPGPFTVGAANGWTRLTGSTFGGGSGAAVAGADDVTGDGRPDVLIDSMPEDDQAVDPPMKRTVHVVPAPEPSLAPVAITAAPEGAACFTAQVSRASAGRLLKTGRLQVTLRSFVPLGRRASILFELTPVSRKARRRFVGASFRVRATRLPSPGSTTATIRLNRKTLRKLRRGDRVEIVFFGDTGTTSTRFTVG